MKNCTATVQIGLLSSDTFLVSEAAQSDKNTLIEELIKNKDILQQLLEHLNLSGYLKQTFSKKKDALSSYDFEKGIVLGNASMNNILDEVNVPKHIRAGILESEYPMDLHTILIDNSMYYKSKDTYVDVIKLQQQDGQERVVIPNTKSAKLNYIHYRYLVARYLESDVLDRAITKMLEEKFIKSIKNASIKKQLESITETQGKVAKKKQFLQYYFFDAVFHNGINSITSDAFRVLTHALIALVNPESFDIPQLKKFMKDGVLDLEAFYAESQTHSLNYLHTIIQNFNYENNTTFTLDFIDGSKARVIAEQQSNSKPKIQVNTRYYSPITPVYKKYKGFYIYRYNDEFYISQLLIDSLDSFKQLLKLPFTQYKSVLYAQKAIDENWNKFECSMSSVSTRLYKQTRQGDHIITHTRKTIDRQMVPVLDMEYSGEETLSNKIKSLLKDSPSYGVVISKLLAYKQLYGIPNDINVVEVLDSMHKVDVFLDQANAVWLSQENGGIANTTIDAILLLIANAKTIYYRIDASEGNKYKYLEESLPNPTFMVNESFKHDILYSIERMNKYFGVKINILTNADLGQYQHIKDIHRAKAFILNGEIYVNIDKASNKDLMHEYGHLVIGLLKHKNIQSYVQAVSTVTQLPDYALRIKKFREYGDTRSEIDLCEEILVDLFGAYMGHGMRLIYSDQFKQDYIKALLNIFGLESKLDMTQISELNHTSVEEVIKMMGSYMLNINNPFKDVKSTIVPRKIANIISKLKGLEEVCK